KIGNRAMLWGAVAGTIPDLDVFAKAVMDDMSALAFHRGISHSIFFAIVAAPILGKMVQQLYDSNLYQKKAYKIFVLSSLIGLLIFLNFIPVFIKGTISPVFSAIILTLSALVAWRMWKNYVSVPLDEVHASWKEWTSLFFWAIFTHPILDCFTTFGTQLFQPFSDYRVAFNVISVVDLGYTVPLLLCLMFASRIPKNKSKRKWINYAGLAISSAYMLFCFYHKTKVNQVFEDSFKKEGITYQRYMTTPTIFNNILWQGIVETEQEYYHAYYSIWDKTASLSKISKIEKNHQLLDNYKENRAVKILTWFSNNYYNVLQKTDGDLQVNDLRFGSLGDFDDAESYVFKFILKEKNGHLEGYESRNPKRANRAVFKKLWKRLKGI
ncbi:MAG TPA: metal-dependent hydrolase, partial [Saprospiraceae bacterium]|nr:metal-dependent hydrolase [Saprospiraceae bacterium]